MHAILQQIGKIKAIKLSYVLFKAIDIFARDLPGGKRIRIINMRAQHITFNNAIKQLSL
jgi:hypothetical protein